MADKLNHPRQILLVGGPLAGVVHELHGRLMPQKLAMPDADPLNVMTTHWYEVQSDGKAYFSITTERR